MTETKVVPKSSKYKNKVADIMALPKSAGDDLCISAKDMKNLRLQLEFIGELSDEGWQKLHDRFTELVNQENGKIFTLVEERGVKVLNPCDHEAFLKKTGHSDVLTKDAKARLFKETSSEGRENNHGQLTPAGNKASHDLLGVGTVAVAALAAMQQRADFFTNLNMAHKSGTYNKWMHAKTAIPSAETDAFTPFDDTFARHTFDVTDRILQPELSLGDQCREEVRSCGCVSYGTLDLRCDAHREDIHALHGKEDATALRAARAAGSMPSHTRDVVSEEVHVPEEDKKVQDKLWKMKMLVQNESFDVMHSKPNC